MARRLAQPSAEFLALCDRVRGASTPAGQQNSTVAHTQ
jgi:hypothetical protein